MSTPTAVRDGGRCVSLRVGAQVAMAAWFHDSEECWADSKRTPVDVKLPWQDVVGLESACRNGGFAAVFLFVYGHQRIVNVPDQVMQRPADEFLEWESAQAMHKRGVPVAHLSDCVRIRAAVHEGGVVLDSDNWVVRPFPRSPFVATLFEKREGGRAGPSEATSDRYAAFKRPGWDGLGLVNTPFGVLPRPSTLANRLGQLVDSFIETYTTQDFNLDKEWNVLMHGVRDIFLQLDMGCEARPPIEFGASLSWGSHRKKPSRSHGVEPIP